MLPKSLEIILKRHSAKPCSLETPVGCGAQQLLQSSLGFAIDLHKSGFPVSLLDGLGSLLG